MLDCAQGLASHPRAGQSRAAGLAQALEAGMELVPWEKEGL